MKSNKPYFFLFVALIGFTAFFLPWIETINGTILGSETSRLSEEFCINNSILFYMFPTAFLISGLAHFNFFNCISKNLIKMIEFIPLSLLFFIVLNLFFETNFSTSPFGLTNSVIDTINIGLYLTVSSAVLIVFTPRDNK